MTNRLTQWILIAGAVALPFVLVNGSYALVELATPNVIQVAHWEIASSLVFIANIAVVLWALRKSNLKAFARLALGSFSSLLMLGAAIVMQSHSKCGEPRSIYIGERMAEETIQTASCKNEGPL